MWPPWMILLLPGLLSGQMAPSPLGTPQAEISVIPSPTPAFTPAPSAGAAPDQEIEGKFTPVPGEKLKLEDWIEHPSSGKAPKERSLTKPGVWLSQISVGAGIPQSPNLQAAYATAFHLGLGVGLRVSAPLSLWLDCDIDQFNEKNSSLTNNNNYLFVGFAGLGRWRFLTSDFSPFLFLGPGMAYNENRSTIPTYDSSYDIVTVPVSGSEVDFLAEGGAGVGYEAMNGLELFLQGRMLWDLTSPHFAGIAYTDSPVKLIPVEGGVVLCY